MCKKTTTRKIGEALVDSSDAANFYIWLVDQTLEHQTFGKDAVQTTQRQAQGCLAAYFSMDNLAPLGFGYASGNDRGGTAVHSPGR